jgi:hypothetical protein
MTDDKFYEELSNLISGAFDEAFGRKTGNREMPNTKVMDTNPPTIGETNMQEPIDFVAEEEQPQPQHSLYESIEDYTAKTGKRFRMTKNQKARGLSRDEAFVEMYGGTN